MLFLFLDWTSSFLFTFGHYLSSIYRIPYTVWLIDLVFLETVETWQRQRFSLVLLPIRRYQLIISIRFCFGLSFIYMVDKVILQRVVQRFLSEF